MRSRAKILVRKRNLQECAKPTSAPKLARPGPHLNALKHGLRSGHVLLPGDNEAEFRMLRRRLFHLHQPRTITEAQHVETLAANQWRIARCHLEQRFFKYHLGAAMSGHPDATGSLSNPDLHALHHRGTDCQREERRLQISTSESEAALAQHQKQRTQNLTPGNVAVLEDYTVFLAEGEPVVVEEESATAAGAGTEVPGEGTSETPAKTGATSSTDGENSSIPKRDAVPPADHIPEPWNRRQRRRNLATLRREARRVASRRAANG